MKRTPPGLRFFVGAVVSVLFLFFPISTARAAEEAGTIALVSGKVIIRHGEIVTPKALAQDAKPEARFSDNYEKIVGPNDKVMAGDIVMTEDDSYVKIYYNDDSIMDIGPNTTFKVQEFRQAGPIRNISFGMLYGKIRTLVTRALEGKSHYRVATPVSTMGVRGTEFVTHSYLKNNVYKTDITVLEGKVIVDVPKMGPGGKMTTQPITILPGKSFSGSGIQGGVLKYNVSKLTPRLMEKMVAVVPRIETKKAGVAQAPAAHVLPGTGVAAISPQSHRPEADGKGNDPKGRGPASGPGKANAKAGLREGLGFMSFGNAPSQPSKFETPKTATISAVKNGSFVRPTLAGPIMKIGPDSGMRHKKPKRFFKHPLFMPPPPINVTNETYATPSN